MSTTVIRAGTVVRLEAAPGQNLLHALFEADLTTGRAMCAGAGLCGRCRVRYVAGVPDPCEDELNRLTPGEIADGWRLACRQNMRSIDVCLHLPPHSANLPAMIPGDVLAIDIGTTRIKWATGTGTLLSPEYATVNPQMAVGSEVMSRLQYALASEKGRRQLRASVMECLRSIVQNCGAGTLGIAGNSAMIALLLDLDLDGLAYAPYALTWRGGCRVTIGADLPQAYVPTLLGPFIGADISAGLAFLHNQAAEYPFLLADLGTNGEFVLAVTSEMMFACSVPMGPAIEGVGMSCGAIAGPQVVSDVSVSLHGVHWQTAAPLLGISGTGYVSLLAALRRVGVLDRTGHFQVPSMPLGRRTARALQEGPLGRTFVLDDNVFVAERDVEEMLKAKAAMVVAVRALLRTAGLEPGDVRNVFLAGALGEHAPVDDLLELGFLPEVFRGKIHVAGNTSLWGTMLSLLNEKTRDWLADLPEKVRVLSLVDDDEFMTSYVEAMNFER